MNQTTLLFTLTGLAVTIAGLWLTVLRDRRNIVSTRQDRDSKIDLRLERLDTKMETVWGAFTAQLLTVLHHPDPAKIIPDALLKKYEASITRPESINAKELAELVGYMMAVVKNTDLQTEERSSAAQILTLIRHHPLWAPNAKDAAKLAGIIGPDFHPKPVEGGGDD
jgi:hypothetical protein